MAIDGDMGWLEDESWPSFTAYLEGMISHAEKMAAEEKQQGGGTAG